MKFAIMQENLLDVLEQVNKVVKDNHHNPMLRNVMLKAEDATLTVTGSNTQDTVVVRMTCKCEVAGTACLPAKTLLDMVGRLSRERVDLKWDDNTNMLSAAQWDSIKRRVAIAAAQGGGGRPILENVNMTIKDNVLTACAADGFTLAVASYDVAAPDQTVKIWGRLFKSLLVGAEGDVVICYAHETILIKYSNIDFYSNIAEGRYPEVEAIIKDYNKIENVAVIANAGFKHMATVGGIFARDNAKSIKLDINPVGMLPTITMTGKSVERGDIEVIIDAKITGSPVVVSVSYEYLSRFLGAIKDEEVKLLVGDSKSPIFLQPENDARFVYVIMPMG
jgi:DNA polymerase III subunit beta